MIKKIIITMVGLSLAGILGVSAYFIYLANFAPRVPKETRTYVEGVPYKLELAKEDPLSEEGVDVMAINAEVARISYPSAEGFPVLIFLESVILAGPFVVNSETIVSNNAPGGNINPHLIEPGDKIILKYADSGQELKVLRLILGIGEGFVLPQ